MLLNTLRERLDYADEQFWERHGFYDLTDHETSMLDSIEKIRSTFSDVPGSLANRAQEAFALDRVQGRRILDLLIAQLGSDDFPKNATDLILTMTETIEADANNCFPFRSSGEELEISRIDRVIG